MHLRKQYVITPYLMSMVGIYDRNGKLCTLIHETTRKLIVDQSPKEILEESIKWIGYDLRGAVITAKKLLGAIQMCPVMVNPNHRIVLFPTKSPKHPETIWLNPAHIQRTKSKHGMTLVQFSNGSCMLIPARLTSFNTKIQNAEQLENIAAHMAKMSYALILDSTKLQLHS